MEILTVIIPGGYASQGAVCLDCRKTLTEEIEEIGRWKKFLLQDDRMSLEQFACVISQCISAKNLYSACIYIAQHLYTCCYSKPLKTSY